jgi:hypothetical protein
MEYSLSLALFDFVPILAFLVGAYFLVRIAVQHRGTPCGRMMLAGTGLVFTGGFLKASWKILYVLDVGDFQFMSEAQFILLSIGFTGMLVAVSYLARSLARGETLGAALMISTWKIPFLTIMTICSLGAHGILSFISFKKKAPLAGTLFILAILCMLGMSGMASSLEQTVANQWLEEGVNSVGQISFAVGSYLLYKVCRREKVVGIV